MKKIITTTLTLIICEIVFGQVSGNVNYQNQTKFSDRNIDINIPSDLMVIDVKGLANVKADTYVAIFSVTQVGKTAEEVNELIDKRISNSLTEIKAKKSTETYVDMISFVPVYEYEVEKKLFSKKNYNEVPKGFELKKNIHIKYSDPAQLNDFISSLSKEEIYDLVRVDYFSSNLESIKKELMNKAKLVMQEKIKNYEVILGQTFATAEKRLADGYKVVFPVEMYKSYEAYNSSSIYLKKSAIVNQTDKTTTLYYQPVIDKEFDFVINPTILEPVIQVMYEIKLTINQKKEIPTTKEYLLVTPNGEFKSLNMNK
ncbi:SIMPL domain-containing protein [Riemerella anatipestifer]|nr:SIMPL domain-containing protein [Riemerella anatipestifer]MDY3326179.1 SIMPL domain-containing protein [Riemerella anatipestifer]MDY3354529.1 SIMPL domain-containing protein [Riemerella anatipestifer]